MAGLNWVDAVILVLLAVSAIHGFLQGAAVQVFSYAGFILGLILGAKLGPLAGDYVQSPALRIAVVILILFGTASLVGTIGKYIGAKATWAVPKPSPLGVVNAVGGLGVALIVTLASTWLIGGMLAQVRLPITTDFQESRVLRVLTGNLPPAPSVFSSIQRSLLPSGFPPVFAGLEPSPAPEVPVTGIPNLDSVVASARPSVLKITSLGCGRQTSGSGFVAGPGLVVTNAHVVAGVDRPSVVDSAGSHRTSVVLFDPKLDLAILRTTGLAGRPLALQRSQAPRGQQGAALGYPGGGPFTVTPGAVRDYFDEAVGRDIYSRELVSRQVYALDAEVHPGNSGGPFVNAQGEVSGVVFASSLLTPTLSYALTSSEVAVRVDEARGLTAAVDTGPCTR
ncbi:MarP family serine protease [soil metagenome]